MQDTVVVAPPYPYSIMEDHCDVPLEDCWYARPQLFFTCHLHPISARLPKNGLFKIGPDDLVYHLVFFNTFEELKLPITDYYEVGKTRRAFVGQFLRWKLPQRPIKMHQEKKLNI
jgi:hypothetical protein